MNGALDRGERMAAVDEGGADADVVAAVHERGLRRPAAPPSPWPRAAATCSCVIPSMPSHLDVVEGDARAEGDGREDRHLRRGVVPRDVVGRVGLGVAEPLGLGERLGVLAPAVHLAEDEVRRAVDDPEHAMDVRDDERLAQHLDHRDRGADGGLEAQLDARAGSRREELGAAARDELLVRRDDGLAGPEEVEHVLAGRVEPAHHLRDDGDRRVVADRCEVRRQHAGLRREPRSLPASRTSARTTRSRCPVARSISSAAVDEEAVDRGADGAVAEQRNRNVNRRHAPPRLPRGVMSARSSLPTARSALRPPARAARRAAARLRPSRRSTPLRRCRPGSRASSVRIFSRTCSSITRGPRVRSPYSAVSEIGVAHPGEAALPDQVDDQLQLVQALVVGDLGLVAGLDERLEARRGSAR